MRIDKTYTYDEITSLAKQIVTDELARAEKEPEAAEFLRGYAAGAWLLWQTLTHNEATSDQRRADYQMFKKLLGV
jgi:hypothetical protein